MYKYNKEYYLKNREKLLANQKLYRSRVGRSPRIQEWNLENPKKYILNNARSRAGRAGLEFNLEEDDIVIPTICPYLKVPITLTLGEGKKEFNLSIDRIDSNKGYIKGNVQIISKKANTMKSNATTDELITFARSILDILA